MKRNMRANWQIKNLGEICEVIAGQSPEGKYYNKNGDGLPFYQGKKEFTEKYIGGPTTWTTEITKEARAGDVLMSVRAPVGPVNYATERICIGRGLAAIRAGKEIDKDFLFDFLIKHENEIVGNTGAVFNSINKTQIENIIILLPSLPTQRLIVKKLDKIFASIEKAKENAQKNLQNARELFESYLQGVFAKAGAGWEEKALEEVGEITSSKRIYKREYVKDGVPFYRIKEVKELANNKKISTDLFISEKRYVEIKDVYGVPIKGDILLTAVGTIGEIYVVKKGEKFYFKDGNVLWFKGFHSVDPYYLKYVLIAFVEKIKKLSAGAAYKALTIEKLNKHQIFVPPLSEQHAIVKKLDALAGETKKLEAIYQKKLADLEELKKSVLKEAFSAKGG
ncbi:MAG: restriction endonuclease subunit S [Candidatus Margulisiibacteriota bacterium]